MTPKSQHRIYYENQKYFVIHYRTKYLDKDKTYSTIWRFRGQLFKLRAERGQQFFLNISKTKKNLLNIIEAKLLVSTFCISWYQRNENRLRNEEFQGAGSMRLWCFLSFKRKTFCETLYNMNCLKCDSEQYAIFKFCLTSPFKEFRGWPLKVNIVYIMKTKNILLYIIEQKL